VYEENRILGGRYNIIEKIGHGATSNVYLAIDLALHQKWAIKEIKQLTGDEITVLKRVRHALIPQLIDMIEEMEKTYLVFEYIEGCTADVYVKEYGYIKEREALIWCMSLTDILSYLHGLSPPIIHQDIKPSNIIVKPDGTIRLIDFGIAEELYDDRMRERAYGSYGYAAPEQFGDKDGNPLYPIDERTDIYALGKTLQYVLGIKQEGTSVKSALEKVLLQCTSKKPDMRYQTASELSRVAEKLFQKRYVKNQSLVKYIVMTSVFALLIIIGIWQTSVLAKRDKENAVEKVGLYRNTYMSSIENASWNELFFESGKIQFHKFGQYKEALLLFKLVSEEAYPEVHYYINICNSLTELKCNYAIAEYNLHKLVAYKSKKEFSVERAEEILDIGHLYIIYRGELNDSLIKAAEMLEGERQKIKEHMSEQSASELIGNYNERLFEVYYYMEPELTKPESAENIKEAIKYGEEAMMGLRELKQEDEVLICRLAMMYGEQGKEDKVLECYRNGEKVLQFESAELYTDYLTYLSDSYEKKGNQESEMRINEMKAVYSRALMVALKKKNERLDKAMNRVEKIIGGMEGEE